MWHLRLRVGRCRLVAATALLLWPSGTTGDDSPTAADPLALVMAAAMRADLGELERVAPRAPSAELATCVESAPRARRLGCIEVARFSPPSHRLLESLVAALSSRDRAVATAAGAALEEALLPERLRAQGIGADDLRPVVASLLSVLRDARIGPDVRAAGLHALRPLGHASVRGPEIRASLDDADPRIRREALAFFVERGASRDAVERAAQTDPDFQVAALAAAALCESGRIPRSADARVRRMLGDRTLGPATLGPLLACARSRRDAPCQEWLAIARSSPRQDIRALANRE